MAKFQEYIKNVFWVLLVLQFAPSVFKSIAKHYNDYAEPKNKVGLILMNKMIISSASWNKQLTNFFKDPEIKAILIKFDSGGGAAGSSQAIAQEILNLKAKYPKPIISYVENICASGAYEVAAVTDYIVATGSALVGSIGSKITTQFKVKEFLQSYKIQTHDFASSVYKNALDPLVDFTPEQKQMLQQLVDDGADQFVCDIAKYRHLNLSSKNLWAEGKIFTGNEALKLKLIDEIGNQTTALNFIKKQILHVDREIELVAIKGPSMIQRWLHPEVEEMDDVQNSFGFSFAQGLFSCLQKQAVMQ